MSDIYLKARLVQDLFSGHIQTHTDRQTDTQTPRRAKTHSGQTDLIEPINCSVRSQKLRQNGHTWRRNHPLLR